MSTLHSLILILFCGIAGAIGADYSLGQQQGSQKIVVINLKQWSQDLLDKAKETGMSKSDLEVEKRLLARDVNSTLDSLEKLGVLVLDQKYLLTAPNSMYVRR